MLNIVSDAVTATRSADLAPICTTTSSHARLVAMRNCCGISINLRGKLAGVVCPSSMSAVTHAISLFAVRDTPSRRRLATCRKDRGACCVPVRSIRSEWQIRTG